MIDSSYNVLIYIVIAVLTGISGYFTKYIQKFEEKKDEVTVKSLPLMSYNLSQLIRILDAYKGSQHYDKFKHELEKILETLENEISSGNLLFTKLDRTTINNYYSELKLFSENLAENDGEDRKNDLVDAIENGNTNHQTWLKVDPKKLHDNALTLIEEIEKEVNKYRSWGRRIFFMILIIGIIIGISTFLSSLL